MAIEVSIKKWGNSVGVLFPKKLVEEEQLKVNEKVFVEIVKEANLKKIYGSLKRKMSGQQFKNMVRKGWQT